MRNKVLLAIPAMIIIGIFLALSLYYGFLVVKIDELPMDFTVGDKVGFNADTDALHFGTNHPGGTSTRQIRVSNDNDFPVKVMISNTGNLSNWVTVRDYSFNLNPFSSTKVNYSVSIPVDAKLSKYTGISKIVIKRAI